MLKEVEIYLKIRLGGNCTPLDFKFGLKFYVTME